MMVLSIPLVMQGVAVMALANWRQKGKMVVRKRAVMKIWGKTSIKDAAAPSLTEYVKQMVIPSKKNKSKTSLSVQFLSSSVG